MAKKRAPGAKKTIVPPTPPKRVYPGAKSSVQTPQIPSLATERLRGNILPSQIRLGCTGHRPHPLLSIGGYDEEIPEDAQFVVIFGSPYDRTPFTAQQLIEQRNLSENTSSGRATLYGRELMVIRGLPKSDGEGGINHHTLGDAAMLARETMGRGGKVHLQCGSGQVRSVSLGAVILARTAQDGFEEGRLETGEQLLQRLINLRPEALRGLEGDENGLALLRSARYHLEHKCDFETDTVKNLRWL